MGMRWDGPGEGGQRGGRLWELLAGVMGLLVGLAAGITFWDDDPAPHVVTPKVNVETEALLDAATIEMRGYDESGKPGTFLYECEYKEKRLVCEQVPAK